MLASGSRPRARRGDSSLPRFSPLGFARSLAASVLPRWRRAVARCLDSPALASRGRSLHRFSRAGVARVARCLGPPALASRDRPLPRFSRAGVARSLAASVLPRWRRAPARCLGSPALASRGRSLPRFYRAGVERPEFWWQAALRSSFLAPPCIARARVFQHNRQGARSFLVHTRGPPTPRLPRPPYRSPPPRRQRLGEEPRLRALHARTIERSPSADRRVLDGVLDCPSVLERRGVTHVPGLDRVGERSAPRDGRGHRETCAGGVRESARWCAGAWRGALVSSQGLWRRGGRRAIRWSRQARSGWAPRVN